MPGRPLLWLVALALLLTVLVVLLSADGGAEDDEVRDAVVARIVDGDTLELVDGAHVRLVQIDAPELGERECYARDAREALAVLVPRGVSITLERDPALDDRDRFGRELRYVRREGRNVNVELVRRGAASVWFFEGTRGRYAAELLGAVEAAEREERGLWGLCPAARLDPLRGVETGDRQS